jgi:hypothetical protein
MANKIAVEKDSGKMHRTPVQLSGLPTRLTRRASSEGKRWRGAIPCLPDPQPLPPSSNLGRFLCRLGRLLGR